MVGHIEKSTLLGLKKVEAPFRTFKARVCPRRITLGVGVTVASGGPCGRKLLWGVGVTVASGGPCGRKLLGLGLA